MFRNDSFKQDAAVPKEADFDEASKLGMEARSILKSIRTEESKLLYSSNLTRSDRHYFRARADYYRLSLKRLPTEERIYLEPSLARFNERITRLEHEDGIVEAKPLPFLAPVEKTSVDSQILAASENLSLPEIKTTLPNFPSQVISETISQLSLVQMALSADINADSRRILAEGLERVIDRLKTL
jgi:hypothetical protein